MQTYDINRFLQEVQELLRTAGVEPTSPVGDDQPRPDVAAGMLLRSFGITPVADHVDVLARSMDRPWGHQDI